MPESRSSLAFKSEPNVSGYRPVWVLGTRGVPNRYGGFEALAQEISEEIAAVGGKCVVLANSVEVCWHSKALRLLLSISPNLLTPVATWINARKILGDTGDFVLVTNPVNVLVALKLARIGHFVLLHLDGIEDRRKKWRGIHRVAHRLARWLAVRSSLTLVSDSKAIQDWYEVEHNRKSCFIPYGGCRDAMLDASHRWSYAGVQKFLVIARPVPENHTLEIIRAFNLSGNLGRLEIVGEPARSDRYWREICLESARNPRVVLRGAVWQRAEICQTLLNSSALIHGHSVGGTNPSLVDAASHGIPILAHDNLFNREVLNGRGTFWSDQESLKGILASFDSFPVQPDIHECHSRYQWNQVARSYLDLFEALAKH